MNIALQTKTLEFDFSQQQFEILRGIITTETGIELPDSKKELMYGRLVRRLRSLSLKSFDEYISLVKGQLSNNDSTELLEMINAMTTNVTSFFREKHHFDHLAKELPALLQKFGDVKIWSAAASIGAEAYSAAMVVQEFIKANPAAKGRIKIYGTDLDSTAIMQANTGIYWFKGDEVEKDALMKKYLKPTGKKRESLFPELEYEIAPELKTLCTFKQMNLLKPWPADLPSKFHVVFCRNVIIYFSKDTQRGLFKHIEQRMPAESALYIGHSESLINVSTEFQLIGATAYRRKADTE